MSLGSNVTMVALEGYALLKVSGRNQGLEDPRQQLSSRFGGGPLKPAPTPTD